MQEVFYGAYLDHGGQDYECSFKWYSGHGGVDILLRNFTVQDSGVAVLAAAPGTVFLTRDGVFDRSTTNGDGGLGNYVAIEHGTGGPISYYGHMRQGSIRVAQNAAVARGDTLGLVGSSGNSNWPHLHFEVRESGKTVPVDPFLGGCNRPDTQPTWVSQLPWQGDFAVLDAGISNRASLTFAELLERPADVATVTAADLRVVFWANLFNVQALSTRTVLQDAGGTILGVTTTGTFTTFSTRFLAAAFTLGAVGLTAGEYAIALWVTPTNGGVEREVVRRTFTYDPGGVPAPRPAPGAQPGSHSSWISPQAGDGPPEGF